MEICDKGGPQKIKNKGRNRTESNKCQKLKCKEKVKGGDYYGVVEIMRLLQIEEDDISLIKKNNFM